MVGTGPHAAVALAGAALALSACALGNGGQSAASGAEGEPTPAAFAEPGAAAPSTQQPAGPPDLPVNPFDPVALNDLAIEHAERGDLGKAQELLERAAKLAPDDEDIAANLADIRQMRESLSAPSQADGASASSPAPDYGDYGDPEESGGPGVMPPPPPRW